MNEAVAAEVFVGRQPILDQHENLVAYELLFRNSRKNFAEIRDEAAATATVLGRVFSQFGIEVALGAYQGYINIDESVLMSDMLEALPADRIVLEILETVAVTPQVLSRCRELKELGYTIAIDDYMGEAEKYAELLEIVDIVKVDIASLDSDQIAKIAASLQRGSITMLAEKVDSHEQVQQCKRLGFTLFQGYYYKKPQVLKGRALEPAETTILRVVALLLSEADTSEIVNLIKQEPGLSMNLLGIANCAANGLRSKVTSILNAVNVVGRRQLLRWMQILLYSSGGRTMGSTRPLLALASTRARIMELIAERITSSSEDFSDQAFMTGILSLVPSLLGVDMESVIDELPVSEAVRDALVDRGGQLGELLAVVEELETLDMTGFDKVTISFPKLDADAMTRLVADAHNWANEIAAAA